MSASQTLSSIQRSVLARAAARASAPVVATGQQELRELIGSAETRRYLREFDDGSRLHSLSSGELLRRLRAEFAVLEVVHNFDVSGRHGIDQGGGAKVYCGPDLTTEAGPQAEWFYNEWELHLKNMTPVPDPKVVDDVQTQVFGFPTFADRRSPDWPTASDRFVWGALNIYRKSTGNPVCGPVAAVFSRAFIGDQAILSALDSGIRELVWRDMHSQPANDFYCGVVDCETIKDWREGFSPISSASEYLHLLPTHLQLLRGTRSLAGRAYRSYNMARLLLRALSRNTYPAAFDDSEGSALRLNFQEKRFGYLEFNTLKRIRFHGGVLMMVASFSELIGSTKADHLREWCIQRKWPLAWCDTRAIAQISSRTTPLYSLFCPRCSSDCVHPPRRAHNPYPYGGLSCQASSRLCLEEHDVDVDFYAANVRLLDPEVLAAIPHGHNLSRVKSFMEGARAFQLTAEAAGRAQISNSTAAWERLLQQPHVAELAVEPVFAGACTSKSCVGVRITDGTCVCPRAVAETQHAFATKLSRSSLQPRPNMYISTSGVVGIWGGACTCPDGTVYQVGDWANMCRSMACFAGKAGTCNQREGVWSHGLAICAPPKQTPVTIVDNEAPNVGMFGEGLCTCPDGLSYTVGDNNDNCGSLACVGGLAGQCNRSSPRAVSTTRVICAAPDPRHPVSAPAPPTSPCPSFLADAEEAHEKGTSSLLNKLLSRSTLTPPPHPESPLPNASPPALPPSHPERAAAPTDRSGYEPSLQSVQSVNTAVVASSTVSMALASTPVSNPETGSSFTAQVSLLAALAAVACAGFVCYLRRYKRLRFSHASGGPAVMSRAKSSEAGVFIRDLQVRRAAHLRAAQEEYIELAGETDTGKPGPRINCLPSDLATEDPRAANVLLLSPDSPPPAAFNSGI